MNLVIAKLLQDIVKASKHDDDSPSVDWKAWGSTTGGEVRISWFVSDFPDADKFTARLTAAGFERMPTAPHFQKWRGWL
jgi:hypothetical protein